MKILKIIGKSLLIIIFLLFTATVLQASYLTISQANQPINFSGQQITLDMSNYNKTNALVPLDSPWYNVTIKISGKKTITLDAVGDYPFQLKLPDNNIITSKTESLHFIQKEVIKTNISSGVLTYSSNSGDILINFTSEGNQSISVYRSQVDKVSTVVYCIFGLIIFILVCWYTKKKF